MQRLYALVFIFITVSLFSAQTPEPAKSATPQTAVTSVAAGTGNGTRDYLHDMPEEKKRPVRIPKFTAAPTIDGKLDDEVWKTAAVFNDFIQVGPGNNIAPSRPTEAYMGYDEKNLYIAFKCWDERDKIKASLAKRDEVFNEDNVRMWLDTYNDQRRAYVLGFNPLGVQQDGIYTEGQGADFSVDIVMESKGVIEDWGWSVEVKVPFKSLRYVAGKGKLWGLNLARNIDRFNDEFDQWLPDDRNISGFLIKHGKITGLDEIKTERTLEIVPSITLSETGSRKRTTRIPAVNANGFDPIFNPFGIQDPGRFVNDPIKHDLGVNIKYTITPNITLDAAINPDFAEIEADAPVVTANQRFPLFFQEKRPFFLEGKEIFDSPLSPFYSRTIVDPDLAAKLTGKIGKNSFGFLVASDNRPGNFNEDERGELIDCQRSRLYSTAFIRCPNEDIVDKNAFFSVLRLKRDIGKENNIGFFGTVRIFPKDRNYVGGFDGKFKLDPKTVMQFQVLGTHSRKFFFEPDAGINDNPVPYRTGNGFGYFWSLDYTAETHGWYAEIAGRTGDYRADTGFTRRTNTNSGFFANRVSTKSKPKAALIRLDWQQFGRYTFDWNGRTQGGFLGTGFNVQLQGSTFIYFETGASFEKIYEDEFGFKRIVNPDPNLSRAGAFFGGPTRSATQPYFSFNINKNVNKKFFFYGFVGTVWNAFDFDFGAGRYQRVSPAFLDYLNGPIYGNYIHLLQLSQTDPTVIVPDPQIPNLDPGKGTQFDVQGGFEYKPINPLRVSLDYTKSRLTRNDTGQTAFNTNIFTLRSTYQFSRFTFVRARWDYDTLNSNASGQFLFGWNPNPGTAFYVGYNDNFNYNGFSPITGQFEPRFERNSRTFFIRASYLFRKSF
jgi:hypothetical protein